MVLTYVSRKCIIISNMQSPKLEIMLIPPGFVATSNVLLRHAAKIDLQVIYPYNIWVKQL